MRGCFSRLRVGDPTPTNVNRAGTKYTNGLSLSHFPPLSLSRFLAFLAWLCMALRLPRFLSVLISVNLRPYFPKNLKPAMCPYRFIRSILVGDLPRTLFFRREPKNPAICVKFFTKKLLTDFSIRCIIGVSQTLIEGRLCQRFVALASQRTPENRPNSLAYTLLTKGFLFL